MSSQSIPTATRAARPALVRRVPIALALVALGAQAGAGCAAAGSGERDGTPRRAHVLVEEEIQAGSHQTAFDVIRSLRPAWLRDRPRSVTNPDGAEVAVYLDGVRVGGISSLTQIRSQNIQRMEFMTPSDATTRYGTGHAGGAIIIMTRRG